MIARGQAPLPQVVRNDGVTLVTNCAICMMDINGVVKRDSNDGLGIGASPADRIAHDQTRQHNRRAVDEGRDVLPQIAAHAENGQGHYTPVYQHRREQYRCLSCSLDEAGYPADSMAHMDAATVPAHLASARHRRRVADGRRRIFDARGAAWVHP